MIHQNPLAHGGRQVNMRRGLTYMQESRLQIRPIKIRPNPPGFEQKSFERLSQAVKSILAKEPINFSREELYRWAESSCVAQR
mmetsp:Transcript_4553/g.8306  ORF Transcript_4553/g.8306 Transcript_4553/m.8306 type:complete len:83 (-) Transcript_4553:252-500(-)